MTPSSVVRVADGTNNRPINVSGKIVSIKQGVDLSTPHQEIGTREFGDVTHVDIQDGGCRRDRDRFNGGVG